MSYYEQKRKEAARARHYRAAHPERKREQNARYYANNRDACKRASKRWKKNNWPLVLIQVKQRRLGFKATPIADLRKGAIT